MAAARPRVAHPVMGAGGRGDLDFGADDVISGQRSRGGRRRGAGAGFHEAR
jgi:hypothetical protein